MNKLTGTRRLITGIRRIAGSLHTKASAAAVTAVLFLAAAGGFAVLIQGCSFALVDEGMPAAALSADTEEMDLPEQLSKAFIPFHVIANSDSSADQALKQDVRQAVTDYLKPLLEDVTDIGTARSILEEQLPAVTSLTEDILTRSNAGYGYRASLEKVYFPLKVYGDIVLPPGEYEALRIILGNGSGGNWWCVMFPPLCFIDASLGIVPEESKETLKILLTEDAYDSILQKEEEWEPRFWLIDWIRELFS